MTAIDRLRPPPGRRSPADLLAFGVVNLDKPPGPSAHQVAGWVRDIADVDRAAHAGTLDPKVTGCLPVLLGDAARAAQIFDDARKGYVAALELHAPAPDDFRATLAEFEGPILQRPPRKSAVARRLRERTIHALDVLEREDRRALLRVRCEAGTYVRKLCHDLGLALGTGAHMGDLRRVSTAGFDDTGLATMHDLHDAIVEWRERGEETPLRAVVSPAERALSRAGIPSVTIARSAAAEVAEGAPVYAPGVIDVAGGGRPGGRDEPADPDGPDDRDAADGTTPTEGALVACYTPDGGAVCLGRLVGDPDANRGTVVELERVLV